MPKRKHSNEDMIQVKWDKGGVSWVLVKHIKLIEGDTAILPNTRIKMGRHHATVLPTK